MMQAITHAKLRLAAAVVAMGCFASPLSAGPILSSGGYWGLFSWDTEVACGTMCQTDTVQFANVETFGLHGVNGRTNTSQSGQAYAAMSVLGNGTEFETDTIYQYQLVVARSFFASVEADAPASAFARAGANLTGFFGFELSETVRYTGSSFGSFTHGMILGPGVHQGFFGGSFGNPSFLTTATVRAGERDFASDIGVFTFRVESVSVPEPGTLALLGFGLAGLGLARRRR